MQGHFPQAARKGTETDITGGSPHCVQLCAEIAGMSDEYAFDRARVKNHTWVVWGATKSKSVPIYKNRWIGQNYVYVITRQQSQVQEPLTFCPEGW